MKRIFILILFLIAQKGFSQKGDKFVINDYLITFPKIVELKNLNKVSGQYHFVDNKKGNIQISVRDVSKMEFYQPEYNQTELLEAFYKWDFDYWKTNSVGAEISEVGKYLDKNYILWKVTMKEGSTFFLFGIKDEKIFSISINNDKLSEEKQIKYLTDLFNTITKFKQ